jgi:hypothetical protein
VKYEMVFGYLEGVPLFFKELLCNLSILELCSMLTFCTWCVLLLFYDICKHLDHNTCEAFKCKALRTKLFEGGYYVMTQGGHIYG